MKKSNSEIMLSNNIGPLPKKSDAPSEKVEKSSGDLDDIVLPFSLD